MADLRVAHTTCPLCEATCGLQLTLDGERFVRVRGDRDDVFSAGYLCPKGASLGALDADPDRLRTPRVRRDGKLAPATWLEAFQAVAVGLTRVIDTRDRNAVALYLGNPTVHRLAGGFYAAPLRRALGSRNVFTASTLDQMPKHVACGYLFGSLFAIPVPDVDRTDFLLILGADPWSSNGSLWTAPDLPGRLKALQARGGRFVVVDPRRSRTAKAADKHVPIRPGTDVFLLLGMVHELFARDLVALGRLDRHVVGVAKLRELTRPFSPDAVAARCGVDAAAHGERRRREHARPAPGFTTGRWRSRVRRLPEVAGELPAVTLVDEMETPGAGQVRALITVAGNPVLSVPNSGRLDRALAALDFVVCVDPYVNETTWHADVILPPPPPSRRAHYDLAFYGYAVRNVANYSPPVLPLGEDMVDESEILLRLITILTGLGPDADLGALEEQLLCRELAKRTEDPASPVYGQDGTALRGALTGETRTDRLLDLKLRCGAYGDWFGEVPGGLSLRRLCEHPHGVDLGPLRERIPEVLRTPSGRIELCPAPLANDLIRVRDALHARDDALVLVGRRQLRSNNSWLHNVPALVKGNGLCTLQVHPVDAARLNLADGGRAVVGSRVGRVEVLVEVTTDVAPGVVSLSHGWGHDLPGVELLVARRHAGVNTNLLTDDARLDPLSGTAVLNGVRVDVTPIRQPATPVIAKETTRI